jgi:hypothetical protein
MKPLLLILLLSPLLHSCKDCGPQQELDARVSISGQPSRLNKAQAIGALSQDIFNNLADKELRTTHTFDVPISLHTDSTTYIFEFENRTDTLTIYYKRKFYHKDGCGFVVDLVESAGDRTYQSTFSKVDVSFQPYVLSERKRFYKRYTTGIDINVIL